MEVREGGLEGEGVEARGGAPPANPIVLEGRVRVVVDADLGEEEAGGGCEGGAGVGAGVGVEGGVGAPEGEERGVVHVGVGGHPGYAAHAGVQVS